MGIYKTVEELNHAEIMELKEAYFEQLQADFEDEDMPSCPEEIPNEIIMEHYRDFLFSPDDFFGNCVG